MEDYSAPICRAKTYLKEAEDCLRNKEWDRGLAMLKLCDTEVRQAIAWVDSVDT